MGSVKKLNFESVETINEICFGVPTMFRGIGGVLLGIESTGTLVWFERGCFAVRDLFLFHSQPFSLLSFAE
jgi:hypothetical protein